MKIPLYRPRIGEKEKRAVLRVLASKKLSRGEEVETFEREFARYVGRKYAIAVNSGTSGLHLLVRCLGWKSGDEIITTPFSYIASSNVILLENAKPVFVDIDERTFNIDPRKIEEKINPKTKGILLVHILGLPVDYEAIRRISNKYKLPIIEDACEALGRPAKNFPVSRLGVATVYGFHENKQLTSGGEGGMIVTDDLRVARKCRSLRDQGRSLDKDWLRKVILGFNFRMTEVQAAFGRAQLDTIRSTLAERERIAKKYSDLLRGLDGLVTPADLTVSKRSWFLYFILLKDSKTREKIQKALRQFGVESSTNYFPPIYKFPAYKPYWKGKYPITERISRGLLALPMFSGMQEKEIRHIVRIIRKTLA